MRGCIQQEGIIHCKGVAAESVWCCGYQVAPLQDRLQNLQPIFLGAVSVHILYILTRGAQKAQPIQFKLMGIADPAGIIADIRLWSGPQ